MYFAIVLLALLAFKVEAQSTKPAIAVYYESHCPDSIAFIRDKLGPTIKHIGIENVDLTMYPFGKAKIEENGEITCRHGADECVANRYQVCVKNMHDIKTLLSYVHCMESAIKPQKPFDLKESCAELNNLDVAAIKTCANGDSGAQLLKEQGNITKMLNPAPSFVPWITINNQHTQEIQDGALNNLQALLCSYFQAESKPANCDVPMVN